MRLRKLAALAALLLTGCYQDIPHHLDYTWRVVRVDDNATRPWSVAPCSNADCGDVSSKDITGYRCATPEEAQGIADELNHYHHARVRILEVR